MGSRAIAFLATADAERAVPFYRDLLGLTLVEDTPFASVFDAYGTMLRLQKTAVVVKQPYTAFGLEVDGIEAEMKRLIGLGLEPVRYPQFEQDSLGIWTAPGGARIAWLLDPDENLISLSQF